MDTKQATCPHCHQLLDTYVQALHPKSTRQPSTIATCWTAGCPRNGITREINDLLSLTDEVVASFHTAKSA